MIQENELLRRTFEGFGTEGIALLQKLSKNEQDELRETLARVLVDAAKDSDAGVTTSTEELGAGHNFKSIIGRTPGAKTNRIYSFTFKDAAVQTMLPVMGIALTIYTGKWGIAAIPQVGAVLKTLWSNLVVLKRPEDADAIDVVRAIVRVRAQHVLNGSNEHPTTRELERDSGLATDALLAALKTLKSRGIIEASTWAAQTDDMSQQGNRWKVKL